jgi:type II secretory pathway pseudopilin PulG
MPMTENSGATVAYVERVRAVRRDESGQTLTELLVVLVILVVVVGGLAQLFTSASNAEVDMNGRFQAQEQASLTLDQLRREIHCAAAVSSIGGAWPTQAITITIGSYCPSNLTGSATITWCTSASGSFYKLTRYTGSACAGSGRIWATKIVPTATAPLGKIFGGPPTPSQPAMASPILTLSSTAGSLGSSSVDTTYGYVVDPVTAAGEQPGSEAVVTLAAGTSNRSITLDWSGTCPPYAGVTSYKVYGRTAGGERLMTTVTPSLVTPCDSASTSITDNGTTYTPSTSSPVGPTLSKLSVDIPVRVDTSTHRLADIKDDIVLRNTTR